MEPEDSLPHSQSPPRAPILSQINPAHAPSHFLRIHFNIILPYSRIASNKRNLINRLQ